MANLISKAVQKNTKADPWIYIIGLGWSKETKKKQGTIYCGVSCVRELSGAVVAPNGHLEFYN